MQSARDVNARGEDLEPRIIENGGVRKINMNVATACCERDLSQINFRCISENRHLIGHGLFYVQY